MSLFKKATASVALVALVSGVFSTGVNAYSGAQLEAANLLASQGIINNHSDDAAAYNLDQNVLRQEIAAVARGVAGLDKKSTCDNSFADVSATTPNNWACFSVEALLDAGLIAANANFNPERNISKAEALGMMVKAAGLDYAFDASAGTSWQEQIVAFAVEAGIVSNFTDYDTSATRGWVFKAAVDAQAAVEAEEEDDDLLGDLLGGLDDEDDMTDEDATEDDTDTVVSGSNVLEVTLAADTAESATVPRNINGLAVASFDFTAGSEDVTISSLTVKRRGLSDEDTLDNLAVFTDEGRASKSKDDSQENDTEASLTLSEGGVVVKAGETRTLTIVADVTGSASQEFAIELVEVTASSDVEGVSNLVGNTIRIGAVEAAKLVFTAGSSVADVKVGDEQEEIFKFEVEGDNDTDVVLKSITFKGEGDVDEEDELANYSLEFDGEIVATTASANGKYVTFDLGDGITIREDKTEKFTVLADVIGGVERTIEFVIDKPLDVTAEDTQYGFGASIDQSAIESTAIDSVDIDAGELTLVDIDAPADKIRADKKDVVLGTIKVTNVSGAELELQKLGVSVDLDGNTKTSTGADTGVAATLDDVFENFAAEINGTEYDLEATNAELATDTGVFKDTDLDITLPEGVTTIVFKADTKDGFYSDVTVDLSVTTGGNEFFVVETEDDTEVEDITPASLTFKKLTVIEAGATASATPLADATVVRGAKGVVVSQFEVEAEEASSIEIDEVIADIALDSGAFNTTTRRPNLFVAQVSLYKGSVSDSNLLDRVSGSQIATDGTTTFNGFKVNVDADETENFIVTLDVVDGNDVEGEVISASVTTISAEDDDSDDITVSGLPVVGGKDVTVTGAGELTITGDANNADNEDPKTILGGESVVVFSADVLATNEPVDVEVVTFVYTGADLTNAVTNASLYLGDKLISTNTNSDITFGGSTGTIVFDDLTSLIVPEETKELKLKLNTATIGYQKVGNTAMDVQIVDVQVATTDAEGVESGKDVSTINVSVDATDSEVFDIVPAKVVASVSQTLSSGQAKLKLTVDTGNNTQSGSNAKPSILVTDLVFSELGNNADGYKIYKEGQSSRQGTISSGGVFTKGSMSTADLTISNSATYVIVPTGTVDKTYTLSLTKEGVVYDVNNVDNSTDLTSNALEELELGTKSY